MGEAQLNTRQAEQYHNLCMFMPWPGFADLYWLRQSMGHHGFAGVVYRAFELSLSWALLGLV